MILLLDNYDSFTYPAFAGAELQLGPDRPEASVPTTTMVPLAFSLPSSGPHMEP